ncbi:hypothetical protein MLD38_033317 [Melastoma candidum]|uniref:Uncharacterized protein n=1 Tax=Melastoma candidum TaxID=119954 RepID=A0ACB9M7N7_9MYRT|nr:hypothetical protein MLD38_033317 [Melastoma candidum]
MCSWRKKMFENLDIPDIVSWNIMTGAWDKSKTPENALSNLYKMSLNGLKPNQTTFASSESAFEIPQYGEYVHGKLIKTSLEMDVWLVVLWLTSAESLTYWKMPIGVLITSCQECSFMECFDMWL